ncbi:MAG: type II secretion system protein GspJ [Candidatus Binatia bacterium]
MRSRWLEPKSGFTLIELILAMTLAVMIVTLLYAAFYMGYRAMEKSSSRSELSQRLRSIESFLGGYIRSAFPYRDSSQGSAIFFSGEEDRLTFISALSIGMGGRGMSRVSLSWSDEEGGALILEEEIPVRLLSEEEKENGAGHRNRMVLWQGVRELRIEYLDPKREGEEWAEQWDGRERRVLPRAVRVGLRGEGQEEIRWVFPVMMSVLAL